MWDMAVGDLIKALLRIWGIWEVKAIIRSWSSAVVTEKEPNSQGSNAFLHRSSRSMSSNRGGTSTMGAP